MFKVMEKQCDQCLFTKDRIVSAERAKQLIDSCKKDDTFFICHKSSIAGENACCRAFYDTQDTTIIQIANRLDFVSFVKETTE